MAVNIKSNPDGTSGAIQVNGADVVAFNATGITSGVSISPWVSGTTYFINNVVISPANSGIYRRITPGAGTIDPSLDTTNWASVSIPSPAVDIALMSAGIF